MDVAFGLCGVGAVGRTSGCRAAVGGKCRSDGRRFAAVRVRCSADPVDKLREKAAALKPQEVEGVSADPVDKLREAATALKPQEVESVSGHLETPEQATVNKKLASEIYADLSLKKYQAKPGSAWYIGKRFFKRELRGIIEQVMEEIGAVFGRKRKVKLADSFGFVLDNEKVRARELAREAEKPLYDMSPWISRVVYSTVCAILDVAFDNRPIARFWFLETVARMPYFAALSVLHLYETFGWWHVAELRQIHFAEDWNELHHLLIMESLGGDLVWSDRFLASHSALVYYWLLVLTFVLSPATSYNFSELLENHAVDTYEEFYIENEKLLKTLPAPTIAKQYYEMGDLYLFDAFQTDSLPYNRRPKCDDLYDVFINICRDECEHVKTMEACSDYTKLGKFVQSPHQKYYEQLQKQDAEAAKEAHKPPELIRDEKTPYEDGMGL